jgi:thymidylate kinase
LVPRLIAFFGADGTGKSTHAEFLFNYLKSNHVKVKRVWIRSPHTLAYLASVFFVKIGFFRLVPNPYGKTKKYPAVHINWPIRFFWSQLELVSVIPVIITRIYLPLLLGYTVIAERYVADTIVTIAYYINNLRFLRSFTAKILLIFIPKKTILIHLDSDYSTLLKRRGFKVEAYDFIEFQRKGYKIIGNIVETIFIDTSNITVEETFMRIMSQIEIK